MVRVAAAMSSCLPELTRWSSCGQYLRWIASLDEEAGGHYEVLHGEKFEQAFDAMRRKKRPRSDGSKGRPFSGMHKVCTRVTSGWQRPDYQVSDTSM